MTKFDVWSWRKVRVLLGGVLVAALTACGGGGGSAGTPVVGPGGGASSPSGAASAVAADLVVVLNKSTMTNSGSDSITATVTSVDTNRAAIGNVPVSFSVNAGAVVTPAGTGTDSKTGQLTAILTQGSNAAARPVTLTVTSGTVSQAVTFNIVQNSTPGNPQAARLTLSLSAFSIDNSGSKVVVATATAIDSNQNALSGIPVQLSVTDGPPLAAATPSSFVIAGSSQTNASGQVSGTINIGSDHSNRQVMVTATSGALTSTAGFQVTGSQFTQATASPSVVTAGAANNKVQYTLSDVNGNPMRGIPITVTGNNGLASRSGTTDENGGYLFTYTAPNAPGGSLQINATAGGVGSTVNVTIAGGSTTVPNATDPVSKTLNLSANVVPVNTATTNNLVSVYAIFRDGSNAPINNVRVLFDAAGDNGTGAIGATDYTKSPPLNNPVLSDATGTASTTYKPGAVSSPTNGVTIRACWKTSDFAAGETVATCPAGNLLTTTLTIVSNPVSISIGTDNSITTGASGLTFVKKYAVLVVDSAGNPKSDVQITPSVDLGGYGKGYWDWNIGTKRWERAPAVGSVGLFAATCANEDLNRNGVIDAGEDINGNKQLDPRKSDVSITLVGATKTDANGVAVLQLEYTKNVGSWVKYKITVTAAGVLSPPAYYPLGEPVALPSQAFPASIDDYLYTYAWLPVAASDLTTESPPPAFTFSPYGKSSSCTDPK
ncbi:Ig-like domain-containing protein [Roseateles sp.]|uniref:Ig-like domain-containing protein n=1 Tax=Roseateles sp. TaxID=1971397 RepID=UPI0025FA23FB|nr:Ig-like domain-containing protein [Roseateles sp.]MBV8037338.1 hypothetical protein [Roseateles sp.]